MQDTIKFLNKDSKKLQIIIIIILIIAGVYFYFVLRETSNLSNSKSKTPFHFTNEALAARFDYLSKNGNSACSSAFRMSIPSMPNDEHLRGSCCSPMNIHRYKEQIEGLKQFKSVTSQNISKIPDDPYNVKVELAKELMSYYDLELTIEEQKAYDYAVANSHEKGPCCCKCWRWYVYGGLGKYLIKNHGFTGEQVVQAWNLSDGCGGAGEHSH